MVGRGMPGRGHAWQGKCAGRGVRHHGGGGGGRAWQEKRPLQRTARILLECMSCFLLNIELDKSIEY